MADATPAALRPGESSRAERLRAGLLVGLLTAVFALAVRPLGQIETLERGWLDTRLRAAPLPKNPQIVLVQIEDADIEALRMAMGLEWPWPLDVNAALVTILHRAGARALVVDILHLDRGAGLADMPKGFIADEATAQRLRLEQMQADPYREALRSWGRAAVAFELATDARYDGAGRRHEALGHLPTNLGPGPAEPRVYPHARWPITRVLEGAQVLGFSNVQPDDDGIVRRVHVLAQLGERVVPGLALAGAVAAAEGPIAGESNAVSIDGVRQRLAPDGSFLVGLGGAERDVAIERVDPSKLIAWFQLLEADGTVPAEATAALERRIVVLGINLAGQKDVIATAAGDLDGPVYQAMALGHLRAGTGRIPAPFWHAVAASLLAGLGLGLAFGLGLGRAAILAVPLVGAALGPGYALLLERGGLAAEVVPPALTAATVGIAWLARTLVQRTRSNRWLEGTFGRYLAPSLIEALKRDPSLVQLGGRERELTILFSDIAGFTKIARRLSAPDLVALLNRYLSMHAGAVMEEAGVVDKFIGDAVMAFYGDPLEQPDQAERACRSALAVLQRMDDVRSFARTLGIEDLEVRIGINSGIAKVGNMGGAQRFDYTCMGDAVNLASRLEGANKAFGTHCLLGPGTWQAVRGPLVTRWIANVVVVGYDTAVPVHELLGLRGQGDAETRAHAFEAAGTAMRADRLVEARTLLQELLASYPGDEAAHVRLREIGELESGAQARPWSGHVVLDAK